MAKIYRALSTWTSGKVMTIIQVFHGAIRCPVPKAVGHVKRHGNRPELKGRSQAELPDSLVNASILPSPVTSSTFLGTDP